MGKIKYQGGITKKIAAGIGKKNRDQFIKLTLDIDSLGAYYQKVAAGSRTIDWDIVSFSSKSDFAEQVLSIFSYVRYVGVPHSWTIYSDGSHTQEHYDVLAAVMPFVHLINFDIKKDKEKIALSLKPAMQPWQKGLFDYAAKHPLGKRLLLYLNHPITRTTLFTDSDIMFYEKASLFHDQLNEDPNGYFLPELGWGCLDSRYTKDIAAQLYQANGGFIIFKKELGIMEPGLRFLESLNGEYEYFSEQTVVHMMAMANKFFPLDPRIFILDTSDQFDYADLLTPDKMAMRHYTGPVRHKMWQKKWDWHLNLTKAI